MTDHGDPVGVHLEGGGQHGRLDDPAGTGFEPQVPLFVDDVQFGVEAPQHRVPHAVGFEGEPQLEPVRGEFDEVAGGLEGGGGVESAPPRGGKDACVLVGDGEGLGPVFVGGDRVGQVPDAGGVRAGAGQFGEEGVVHGVGGGEERRLRGGVCGADLAGALEEHVFQHVGDPGVAEVFVDRADGVVDDQRDRGGLVARQDEEGHAVVEDVPDDRQLFAGGGGGGRGLGREGRGGEEGDGGGDRPVRRVGGGLHRTALPSWQHGHTKAERPPKTILAMDVPHRVQGSPSRP